MNISIELSQKQIVTQYMIQYMNLLQMNHSELENFLEKQSLENPVIEFEKIPVYTTEHIKIRLLLLFQKVIQNGHPMTGRIPVKLKTG